VNLFGPIDPCRWESPTSRTEREKWGTLIVGPRFTWPRDEGHPSVKKVREFKTWLVFSNGDPHGVTVKVAALSAIPPGAAMTMCTVPAALLGTVAVTVVSLTGVKTATRSPKVTLVV